MSTAATGDSSSRVVGVLAIHAAPWNLEFDRLTVELRRLFSEFFGTFLLVSVAAGAGVVGARDGNVSHSAAVVAPGLAVMSIVLFMGAVSGAHLNPVVSLAFALRRDFPWRRVPGYVIAQLAGAVASCAFVRVVLGNYR